MIYRIEIAPAAERGLRRLDAKDRGRISEQIRRLADDPRPPGVDRLSDRESLYRIRVGVYRIIYRIEDDRLLVLVVRIGHRSQVYRRIGRLRKG